MTKQELAARIWATANELRKNIKASEYKDYILGFMFYKYLCDKEVDYLTELGGEIIQVQSPHITDAIVQACKEKQISTLCIGRPALKYPSAILAMVHYRNMLEELAQLGIDLIILA